MVNIARQCSLDGLPPSKKGDWMGICGALNSRGVSGLFTTVNPPRSPFLKREVSKELASQKWLVSVFGQAKELRND
jgi:hypothetical protein